jgi:hypothetical protein
MMPVKGKRHDKDPRTKIQARGKSPAPNFKMRHNQGQLELGIWDLFGIWILGFGIF